MEAADWESFDRLAAELERIPRQERQQWLIDIAIREDLTADIAAMLACYAHSPPNPTLRYEGKSLGNFRVLEFIGAGGLGVVYRAEEAFPRRHVALKLVHPFALSADRCKDFVNEINYQAALRHPHIAPVLSAGLAPDPYGDADVLYYATNLIENACDIVSYANAHDLGHRARLDLFLPVCEAIAYAHARRVIHGDLKPSNVLVGEAGHPFVIDFGLACSISNAPIGLHGTRGYMAPEQTQGAQLTTAGDVYALGVILLEMLDGEHQSGEPGSRSLPLSSPPSRRLNPVAKQLDPELAVIVRRCIEESPNRRYASANGLLLNLKQYRAERRRDQGTITPSHWGVMRVRNPLFTGRKSLLRVIEDALAASGAVALVGLPGIGKTELAIEYAYRHQHEYALLQWIIADSTLNYLSGLLNVARCLNLPEKDADDARRAATAVEHWLGSHDGWLLIIDDLSDNNILERLLACRTHGHVLITSRSQTLPRAVRSIPLPPLTAEEGVELLLARIKPSTDPDLNLPVSAMQDAALEIYKELGGVPLALDQAASFIEETNSDPRRYLEILREKVFALLMEPSSSGFYPRSVAAAWLVLFEKLEEQSPLAADILRSCAFFHSDFIPIELLEYVIEANEVAERGGPGAHAVRAAVRDILRLGLLSRSTDVESVTVHRLVQVVLREGMEPRVRRDWAERAVRGISAALLSDRLQGREQRERLLPHCIECIAFLEPFALPRPGNEVIVARLLRGTGAIFYDLRGMLSESLDHLERALDVLRSPMPRTRSVVRSRIAIQVVLWLISQFSPSPLRAGKAAAGAVPCLKEAILAYERVGVIYWFENDAEKGVFSALRALNLSDAVGDGPERTRSYATICLAFGIMGMQKLARRYRRISKTLVRRLSNDPQTTAWVNLLAGVYSVGTCEWEEAENALQQAIKNAEHLADHRLWAQSSAILGDLLLHREMFDASLDLYRRIILRGTECGDRQVEAWGVQGLVQNFLAMGQTADARILIEENIRLLPAISRDLPTVINTHALHATLLWMLGDTEEALAAADHAGQFLKVARAPAAYYCYDGYRDLATIYLAEWHRRRVDGTQLGEIEAKARRHCEGLRAFARVFPLGRPAAWRCLGTLRWLSAGSPRAAMRAWNKSLSSSRDLRLPREEALTHVEIALQATFLSDDVRAGHQQSAEEASKRLGFVLPRQLHHQLTL